MATKILLIHDAVKDYDIFIESCNADTIPIIITSKDTDVTFAVKLATASLSNIQAIGLVYLIIQETERHIWSILQMNYNQLMSFQ